MKTLLRTDFSLRGYRQYQKSIQKLGVGDSLNLKIVEKENGFKDVFAFSGDEIIGELFKEESDEFIPFLRYPEIFKIQATVKKVLLKEEDQNAIIVDAYVYADDNFDYGKFQNSYSDEGFFTNKTQSASVEDPETKKKSFKEESLDASLHKTPTPAPNPKKQNGCMKALVIGVAVVLVLYFMGKACTPDGSAESVENLSIEADSSALALGPTASTTVDSAKIKDLKSLFTEKKDEFTQTVWVQPKARPQYRNQNAVYAYFEKSDNSVNNFRMVVQYAGEEWLFVRSVKFNVDGKTYDYYATKWDRDNDTSVWEWSDEQVSKTDLPLLTAIANGKVVKYRLVGDKYHEDKTLSEKYKTSIKNTLNYYSAQGGKFY